jgi:hypothetical protein
VVLTDRDVERWGEVPKFSKREDSNIGLKDPAHFKMVGQRLVFQISIPTARKGFGPQQNMESTFG